MVSHLAKARAAIEEVKRFLVADSLEELNKKLDRYYMVLIMRSLHLDIDHVRDQTPSKDGLIATLIQVPNLMKDDNQTEVIETSAMVVPCGRGGAGWTIQGGRSGGSGRPQCSYCKRIEKIVIPCMVFQIKLLMCLNLKN